MLQLPLFQQLGCASNSIACLVYKHVYIMAIKLSYLNVRSILATFAYIFL